MENHICTSCVLYLISKVSTDKRRRQWHPTPVLLAGKSHGRDSLEGCNPWGCWGSDMTERLHFHFSLSWIGEGNGNPVQCSCLENPRDRGAWWAAVYGVTQSWTRLKRLSSSNIFIITTSKSLLDNSVMSILLMFTSIDWLSVWDYPISCMISDFFY